jgi:disulfide bond formation protein DsbB
MNRYAMKFLTTRLVYLYIFLFTVSMIAIALYMEHVMMLEPCPLCIMQRVFFIATGLVALAAFLHNPAGKGQFVYGVTSAVMAMIGGGFAIRQIYLQHLPPDEIPACLPSIGYMIEMDFDKSTILKTLFSGDGNCAEVLWVDPVLGLGIPQWALVGFVMLAGTCIWQGIRKA